MPPDSADNVYKFVVHESSACSDQSESTEKYPLSRDHFNMNKSGKPTEEDFQTRREAIQTLVEQTTALLPACDQSNLSKCGEARHLLAWEICVSSFFER